MTSSEEAAVETAPDATAEQAPPPFQPVVTESAMGSVALQLGHRPPGAPAMTFECVEPTLEQLRSFIDRASELGADPTQPLVVVVVGMRLVALSASVPAHLGSET